MADTGKIALVTGGGTGVGRAVALSLIEAGYRVAVTGRRKEPLEETIALSGARPDQAVALACDVTDPESVEALFAEVAGRFGRLDVLFNNAGTNVPSAPVGDVTPEQWQTVVNVNLTGVFLCTRAAFNLMRKQEPQGGRIINNGSVSATAPRPGSAPYTATKHAITGLTKATALDGRPFDIACGQIDIGNAATDMTSRMNKGVPQADGSIRPEPTMDVRHVGEAVRQMADLPLEANVQFITIMATKMPFVGRG
jgi:NAD(P)-dependent dehydrogenase (short-subunit alcohol dehydrogenase family)